MRLHDTLTATTSELVPRTAGRFEMYVCGPTVQDEPHFGHARAAIVPDVLRRYLEWRGVDVFMVKNITDVDDKIIDRATREGRLPAEVADYFERRFDEQMRRLRVAPAHIHPRATGHVSEMVELIERLIETGAAYETGGDVWFRVRSFPGYGKLSKRDVDELRTGARVEADERKDDPLDFALWKAAKPGEPSWPSPWSRGRPGWHIECSAMATAYLGTDFDLHAGGADLVFPHHEAEVVQAEHLTEQAPFARFWLHTGMVGVDGEKMAKSGGNLVFLSDLMRRWDPAAIRLLLLSHHYRQPWDYHDRALDAAEETLARWRSAANADADRDPTAEDRIGAALDDDLDTPAALAAVDQAVADGAGGTVAWAAGLLGVAMEPARPSVAQKI